MAESEASATPFDPPVVVLPRTMLFGIGALLLHTGLSAVRLLFNIVGLFLDVEVEEGWAVSLLVASVGFCFLALWSLNRGWRVTAMLVTVVAVLALCALAYGQGPVSYGQAGALLFMGIAIWTPSARAYVRDVRAARRVSLT